MRKIVTSALAFLALAGSASAELYTPTNYPFHAAAVANAKMRSGPGSQHMHIDTVRRGDRFVILRCENSFCYADRAIGVPGWIHYELLVEVEAPPTVIKPRPDLLDTPVMRQLPKFSF